MKNTTLCYITRGDQVLMLHRVKKENDLNHDKWIGIGGKCDEGDLEWVDRAFLDQLPKWEGDQIFLDLMWKKVPFFSLKLSYTGETLTFAALNGQPLER